MKATFAHACSRRLLHLYPGAWQERYADEVLAVLEERPATLHTLCDLFFGMLDACLHPELFTERKRAMLQTLGKSQINVYCLALLFAIPWIISQNIFTPLWLTSQLQYATNPPTPLPDTSTITMIQTGLDIAGLCALFVVLVSAFALGRATYRQATARKHKGFSILFIAWMISIAGCVVILPIVLALFFAYSHGNWFYLVNQAVEPLYIKLLFGLAFLGFWAVIIAPFCFFLGKRRAELPLRFLRINFIPTLLVTVIMSGIAGVMVFQTAELSLLAPELVSLKHTIFLDLNILLMALFVVFSYVALWRAFRAQHILVTA